MIDIKDISIKWKTAVPIIFFVTMGILITVIVIGDRTESIVIDEVQRSTLKGYRDTILNALTSMMIAGNYKEAHGPFHEQMGKIAQVKMVRTEHVDKEFGKGHDEHYRIDAVEREAIEKGEEKIVIEGKSIRGVYPYIAKSDVMGKNCLSCHKVSEGRVLGTISIKIPLDESFGRIRTLQYIYIGLGVIGIFVVTGLVIFSRDSKQGLYINRRTIVNGRQT